MKNIIITSAENQAVISTVYSLRKAFYCKIITIDKKPSYISEHIADVHYRCKRKDDEAYLKKILQVSRKHKADAIIPHSIADRILLMKEKETFKEIGTAILSSSIDSINLTENKIRFMDMCKDAGIPYPRQMIVKTAAELKQRAKELGYPQKKVVVKPVISHGSRGFRILNSRLDLKRTFYKQRAGSFEVTMKGILDILGDEFPDLIVSEYLPGKEYSIDCIRHEDLFVAIPRIRSKVEMGLTFEGEVAYRKDLIEYSDKLAERCGLTTVFGFQFKEDSDGNPKIIECNPRIQGTMIIATFAGANLIAASLKKLWGRKVPEFDIDWDTRFIRIFSGISIGEKKHRLECELR